MDWKTHIVSIAQSFVGAFLLGAAVYISNGTGIQWTSSFLIAVLFAGVRQAVKVLWGITLPPVLGGNAK